MICENCGKETEHFFIVAGVEDEPVAVCPHCKRKPLCKTCGKRKNRLVLVPMSTEKMCCACYRRTYGS